MSIRIDEHTVAGCPGCHSTHLEVKSYRNHLNDQLVMMCKCESCGMVFDPNEAVRISEIPDVTDIQTLNNRITALEERVEELTRKIFNEEGKNE